MRRARFGLSRLTSNTEARDQYGKLIDPCQGREKFRSGDNLVMAPQKPAKIAAFSWSYLANGTTVLGVILAAMGGVSFSHFYGAGWAIAWTIPAVVLLCALVVFSVRANLGEKAAEAPSHVIHAI